MNQDFNGQGDSRFGSGQQLVVPIGQSLPAPYDPYGPARGYGTATGDETDAFIVKVFDYLRILNKRKWLILGITLSFVVLSAVRTLMETPLYTATVRLQIDRSVARVVESGNITPVEGSDAEFMRTQYQILESRTMAERVASSLKLGGDPSFFEARSFSPIAWLMGLISPSPVAEDNPENEAAREKAAAYVILGNRSINPIGGSRLVDVNYSDPNPPRAQRIANAYADAYVASNLDKRFQANASAKVFLEDKIAQLKIKLEDSERKMLEFAKKEQIVEVSEKSSIAQSNLGAANSALGGLIADRIKNEQQWKQVEGASEINLPQLLSNGVIAHLREQRKALELDYREKLETYKPSYPTMVQIRNKMKEIDDQTAAEVNAIRASLKAAYDTSAALERETKARIETLQKDVLELQNRSIQYNILKREVDTNRELYGSLLQRYKEVDVASGVGSNNVFVVDAAQTPGAPSSPNLMRALRSAFLLGLGAALGMALLLEKLDDKLRSPEQVEQVSGLSLLGVIPKVASVEEELSDPRSGLAEAYRSLCTALQFTTDQGLPRTLVVTSTGPSEGKSVTSLAIAKHFANIGRKVLLVDGDLRNPSLHKKLNCENSIGLSNYLTGACTPPQTMQATDGPNMAFIASGPLPPNAADLLGSARLHSLLSVGLEVFDFIIVDGPPVMGLADAQLLSSAAAATVFIVGAGESRTRFVRGALRRLQLSRGTVVGAVLTKYDAKAAGYGHGYGYGYGFDYGGSIPQLTVDPSRGQAPQQIGRA